MTRKTITTVTAALAAAALIAGCASEAGTPEPSNNPNTGADAAPGEDTDDGLPHSGAPAVDDPIDTTRWDEDPCATLDEETLADNGFPTRGFEEDLNAMGGPTCSWFLSPSGSGILHVTFTVRTTEGLSAIYASNERGDYNHWEVLDPIRGYPAVNADSGQERIDRGFCIIGIGVRNDRIFTVGIDDTRDDGEPTDDPCGAAAEIAGLVIDTMKKGE